MKIVVYFLNYCIIERYYLGFQAGNGGAEECVVSLDEHDVVLNNVFFFFKELLCTADASSFPRLFSISTSLS